MAKVIIPSPATSSSQEAAQNAITDTFSLGTTVPTTGTYTLGRIVLNTSPLPGAPLGWRCTVAGTPGTWEAINFEPDFPVVPIITPIFQP